MQDPLRVLVIEDSDDDAELLLRLLRREGFAVAPRRVRTEAELEGALGGSNWDLVIADHSLPRLGSARALSIVRARDADLPFLVVSGTIREQDAVELLKAGASDYLLKDRLTRLGPAVRRELAEARLRREHREAQREVERAQARYRSLIDNAVVGVLRAGASGRFTFANRALASMLGYASPEDLLRADPARDVFRDRGDLERLLGIGPEGTIEAMEMDWRRRDGAPIHVRLWGRVVPHAETPYGLELFVEDVTERRGLQRQLEQAQKMEAVGRLAGGIAHDFNNLLVAILGYGEMLRSSLDPEDPRGRAAEQVLKAGQRAAVLTRQLLNFSRRQVVDRARLDLNDVVRDVHAMLARLIGEDVVLETRLDPALPAVMADRGQVEQVLMNLAVNARDAMPHGGRLSIETHAVRLDQPLPALPTPLAPGRYASLSVSDAGTGMDDEVKSHLFEPFFTTKEKGKGTGLGLSTVYGILLQCEGAVRVASEVGAGTRFDVFFPEAGEATAVPRAAPPAVAGNPAPAPRGGETLLLVEDDAAVRDLAREILEDAGYRVLPASTAAEAIAVLARLGDGPVHALVTDIVLPDRTGVELAEHVRATLPGVRILFTSGYTSHSVDLAALERLHAPYLQKPYLPGALLEKVRTALAGAPPRGASGSDGPGGHPVGRGRGDGRGGAA